jgi:hypothetical protein bfra3_15194
MLNSVNSTPLIGSGDMLQSVRELCGSPNSSGNNYFIPDYQRGYRWGEREVTQLLSDLYEFMNQYPNQQDFYCLQPLVVVERKAESLVSLPDSVKEEGTVVYEVVDGQQRLTTIFLLIHYFNEQYRGKSKLTTPQLHFETREGSAAALEGVQIGTNGAAVFGNSGCQLTQSIDFWHIQHAYEYIHHWCVNNLATELQGRFQDFVLDRTKVIWYAVDASQDIIKVFERNNVGKIALTDAELIKAQMLQRNRQGDINALRQQLEIAREWDEMENALRQESLWTFLYGGEVAPVNRIEKLFALVLKQRGFPEGRIFDRVEAYMKKQKEESTPDPNLVQLWSNIKELFFVFTDWYKDHSFYHYIGLLTSMGVSIESIWDKAKNNPLMTKDSFLKELKGIIGARISKTFNYDEEKGFLVPSLEDAKDSYQKRGAVKELILLYNVQLCLRPDCSERLPFNLYHSSGWDLEHIDSQTESDINSLKEQKEWLSDALPFVNNTGLKTRIESYLGEKEVNEFEFADLREQVQKILGEEEDKYSQSIGNLCLLDAKTNRSYQNALYPVKRAKIVKREAEGQYIFPGTRIAFMKFFAGAETERITVWSHNDKVAFEKHIYTTVKDFL